MSTVVALGHFCEVHGPRLVFYTIRNANEPQFVSQCPAGEFKFCAGCKAPLLEGYISTVQTVSPAPLPLPPQSASSSSTSISSNNSLTPLTTQYYCSHSNYDHSHLAHLHTCIARSLSCELSPSNSVAFTSDDIWAIGTAFSLKDAQARGFHRKYCLVFTFLPPTHSSALRNPSSSTDHHHHSHSHHQQHHQHGGGGGGSGSGSGSHSTRTTHKPYIYPSLVPYYDYITEEFYLIAKSIQTECEKVYFKEQSISPQRAVRLAALLEPSNTGGSGSGGIAGAKVFTRNSESGAGARSLPLLTSNPHVFLDMHEKFAKVLHHVDL